MERKKGPPSMEEILDLLNDLIEWDAYVMQSEQEVWKRARKIRDRISANVNPAR